MQQFFSTTVDGRTSAVPSRSRTGTRLALHALLSLTALVASAAMGVSACGGNVATGSSSSGGGGGAAHCIGGIIRNGVCEAKCTPDKCLPGNTCVNNECVLQCANNYDCYLGSQSCVPGKEDDTNVDIMICKESGFAPIGTGCPFQSCDGVTACPDGKFCDYTQCGGDTCTKDDAACGNDPSCMKGLCSDKTRCFVSQCPQADCKSSLFCLSAGDADADAYCTLPDCMNDSACPSGFYCGIVRDPHAVCNAMPAKGNNSLCGKTPEPCINPASPPPGTSYFEGSGCLLRRMCLKRADCAPCAVSNDCSLIPGQSCTGTGPAATDMRCTPDCKVDKDCGPAYHCITNECVPRFIGGCKGTGKFCEPCVNDEDCGMKGTAVVCMELSLTGERACFDRAFTAPCDPLMKDADCPQAPGGRHGHCLDENNGLAPGDLAYHKCYLPYDPNSNKFSCW